METKLLLWELHVAFLFTNGTGRLKAQVASRGCIGLLHDGIMTSTAVVLFNNLFFLNILLFSRFFF